ncbi:MAG: exonuclease SbcCD subunit D [Anaerolineae bacterium]|nr:exonuclease SbcCD subunit D [Anaerolineae bacterium]MDQ7034706.1 exonuclease SbcCD subunit D [Anaerolineae bacterium]
MADPIRVLHFADVHIGMENYGKTDPNSGLSSRVVDFLRRMDEMIDYARENEVDLTIFAGDAFKTRSPNPTYQREFAWRIRDLAELAPVVLLVGNHDLPPNMLKASSIEIYNTLAVPNVFVAHDYDVWRISTRRGDVIVGTAPYPIRARLMQHIETSGHTIRDIDHALEETLTDLLVKLADDADKEAGSDDIPRILTAHFTVRGAKFGSERSVMLGRDVQVGLNLLADNRWDYVALGHIHKHQNLTHDRTDAPPVVYSGSLERIDFGEESDTKGFCWVELERGNAQWDYVRVAARPMVTLRVDCRTETRPTHKVVDMIRKHNLQDAIVRLVVELTPESDASLHDTPIREVLKKSGVFHVAAIKRDIQRPERSRIATNPEGMTHEELLEQYFISREVEPERRAVLLEAARAIIKAETDI